MALQDIIRGIPRPNWLDCVDKLLEKSATYELTKEERDLVCTQLERWFRAGNARHATNWLTIGLIFGKASFTDQVRHAGVLRPSRYDYSVRTVRSAVSRILAARLDLDANVKRYLGSIKNLCILSDAVVTQLQFILHQLDRYRGMIIRQLLACVDLIFMLQATRGITANKLTTGDQIDFYSPEHLAEALSFILYLYHSRFETLATAYRLEEANNQTCFDLLVMAGQIRRFQEFEILVDSFDYHIHFDPSCKVATVCAPTKEFETAIRLGFMGAEIQKQLSLISAPEKEVLSLRKMGEDFYKLAKDKFVKLEEKPFKRYTFRMFTEGPLKDLLSMDTLFAEEEQLLEHASREWLAPISDVLQFAISGELTAWDVVKTQRVFGFFRWYAASHLEPRLEKETDVVLRSLVPSFGEQDILQLLRTAVGDKAPAMLDFLSWHPDRPGVLDLQYQPLLTFGPIILVPVNVLVNSNLLRNSFKVSGMRLYDDGVVDPPVALLENVFRTRTSKVAANVKWSWNDTKGEVDVMASIDGLLFVIECKNSLIPGNVFELRTSYDYIMKASNQLDSFRQALCSDQFRDKISGIIGWRIDRDDRPVTCIAMMNRMFDGYRVGPHAVRATFGIANQVDTGTIVMGEEKQCLWQGHEFTGEDLRRFIEDDSLHTLLWKSMVQHREVIPIRQFEVSYETVHLDLKLFADNAGFREASRILEQHLETSQS